mmetsp:Transcript_15937/g.28927  ORF Transcript_15937/g.28927 Transcript_15937/m.28927 type:complete len:390 (-) Transcript_15937:491-1660(-)
MNASPPPPLVFDSVVAAAAVVVVVVVVPKFRPPRSYVLRWPTEAWRQPSPSRQTQRMQPLALAMVQIGPVPCRRPPSISPFFAPTPNRPGIAYWLGTRLALRCLPQSASAAPTSLTSSLRLASHRFDDPRELSGRDIVVQWAKGKRYEGRITNYDRDTGQHYVEYADGEKKWYDMTTKTFWMYSSCRRFWHKYEPPRGQQEATVATARVTETRVNERRERGLTPIRSFVVDGVELVEDDPVDILFSSDVFSDGDDQWHVGQIVERKEDGRVASIVMMDTEDLCMVSVHCVHDEALLSPFCSKTDRDGGGGGGEDRMMADVKAKVHSARGGGEGEGFDASGDDIVTVAKVSGARAEKKPRRVVLKVTDGGQWAKSCAGTFEFDESLTEVG